MTTMMNPNFINFFIISLICKIHYKPKLKEFEMFMKGLGSNEALSIKNFARNEGMDNYLIIKMVFFFQVGF